jgi:RHS repeat-associated protein
MKLFKAYLIPLFIFLPIILSARPIFVAESSTKSSITLIILIGEFSYGAKGPFGQVIAKSETVENPFQFQTKYYDKETGLSYYGYRYYDPIDGRWVNRDPIGVDGGINLYNFVSNNPVNGFAGRLGYKIGNTNTERPHKIRHWFGLDAYGRKEYDDTPGWDKAYGQYKLSDEHGRALALQWALGWGNPWRIGNKNSTWTTYMKKHQGLSTQVANKMRWASRKIFQKKNMKKGNMYESYEVLIDTSEKLTGYSLLHGTNQFFDSWGKYTVTKLKGGCIKISFDLTHTWNDIIDPNDEYETDIQKSAWVTTQTRYFFDKKPHDYVISIAWNAKATVTLNKEGKIITEDGWPFVNAFDEGVKFEKQEDTDGTGVVNANGSKVGRKSSNRR